MKKLFATIFLLSALLVRACWFTSANFNAVYISGVNNYILHYDEVQDIASATYHNGQTVAMPITVWVKGPARGLPTRKGKKRPAQKRSFRVAPLQYKILPSGSGYSQGLTIIRIGT